MALIETVTDEHDIRRRLAALGLPFEPASFDPARDPEPPSCETPPRRSGPGPPRPDPTEDADPTPLDESGDPPWQDDYPPPLDDDTSQLPPDADS